jgi:hypothetical protein
MKMRTAQTFRRQLRMTPGGYERLDYDMNALWEKVVLCFILLFFFSRGGGRVVLLSFAYVFVSRTL